MSFSDKLLHISPVGAVRELVGHRAHLTKLALLDPPGTNASVERELRNCGHFAGVIEQLVNLRSLAISPAATDHLDQTLAPLTKLEDLSIIQGLALSSSPPSAAQIGAVLDSPAPLRRVAISAALVDAWSDADQQAVAAAAARKGIAFVKL